MFRTPVVAFLCILCTSCATYFTPAPNVSETPIEVNGIRLLNDSPDNQPRIYFSDGITTYRTNFRGWTQVVVNGYGTRLAKQSRSTVQGKALSFSIQGINCSGHYVADCSLSLLVTRSDGAKKVYSTETYNGYPITSALQKALDASISLAISDSELTQFVKQ